MNLSAVYKIHNQLNLFYKVPKANIEPKFDHFKATVGTRIYEPVPIGFLRISELPQLQEMLEAAYQLGRYDGFKEESGQC